MWILVQKTFENWRIFRWQPCSWTYQYWCIDVLYQKCNQIRTLANGIRQFFNNFKTKYCTNSVRFVLQMIKFMDLNIRSIYRVLLIQFINHNMLTIGCATKNWLFKRVLTQKIMRYYMLVELFFNYSFFFFILIFFDYLSKMFRHVAPEEKRFYFFFCSLFIFNYYSLI